MPLPAAAEEAIGNRRIDWWIRAGAWDWEDAIFAITDEDELYRESTREVGRYYGKKSEAGGS